MAKLIMVVEKHALPENAEPIKINNRPVICKYCNSKFFSDIAKQYKFTEERCYCVCPDCNEVNIIKMELTVPQEEETPKIKQPRVSSKVNLLDLI